MLYDQSLTKLWALDREFVDQRVRSTNYRRKTMITIFFGVEEIAFFPVVP
jgi:hypothetical protein